MFWLKDASRVRIWPSKDIYYVDLVSGTQNYGVKYILKIRQKAFCTWNTWHMQKNAHRLIRLKETIQNMFVSVYFVIILLIS